MKKPNITPGPWLRNGSTVFTLTPYAGPDARMARNLSDGINRFSCHVQRDNSEESGGAPPAEIEANAQAIAAVPDLLAALEGCLQSLERMPETEGAYKFTRISEAKAALTKAGYTF